jgi:hypothetical protein
LDSLATAIKAALSWLHEDCSASTDWPLKPDLLERTMELSSLFDSFAGAWGDEILFWVVAAVAGFICLIALVNVLDLFLENEVDPPMKDPR